MIKNWSKTDQKWLLFHQNHDYLFNTKWIKSDQKSIKNHEYLSSSINRSKIDQKSTQNWPLLFRPKKTSKLSSFQNLPKNLDLSKNVKNRLFPRLNDWLKFQKYGSYVDGHENAFFAGSPCSFWPFLIKKPLMGSIRNWWYKSPWWAPT
jgi:hypothetical protein